MNLSNMSSNALMELSRQAADLARDLQKEEPSYELALVNGCYDKGYSTVRYGWVPAFGGTAIILMDNGSVWRATGKGSCGSPGTVSRIGLIVFTKLTGEEAEKAKQERKEIKQ